jgi:CHU_C Type IX secretion signal domain
MKIILIALATLFFGVSFAQSPNAPFRIKVTSQNPQCYESADAAINVTVVGGVMPVVFQVFNMDQGISWGGIIFDFNKKYAIADIPPGNYRLTLSDTLGRDSSVMVHLIAPPPIEMSLDLYGETCYGTDAGWIHINHLSGGTPPFSTSLNSGTPGTLMEWNNMKHGQYFVTAKDANGCRKTIGAILPSGLEFSFELEQDAAQVFSGDTLHIDLGNIPDVAKIEWFPSEGILSNGLSDNLFFPFSNTQYTVQLTDINGCVARDRFTVQVHRARTFYTPNVFSPTAQLTENQHFTIFSNGGIRQMDYLRIWDRQGKLWFEQKNIPPNDPTVGWDGTTPAGDQAPAGVYFWSAHLVFTDGREETLQGDVTVVR